MIDDDRFDDGLVPSVPSAGEEVTEQVVVTAPVGANGGFAHDGSVGERGVEHDAHGGDGGFAQAGVPRGIALAGVPGGDGGFAAGGGIDQAGGIASGDGWRGDGGGGGWAWEERPFAALGLPPQTALPGDAHQAVVPPHQVSAQAATVAAAVTSTAGLETLASPVGSGGGLTSASAAAAAPTWQVRLWRAVSRQARFGAMAGVLVGLVLGVLGGVAASHGATRWTSTTTMMIDDPYQLATAGDQGELLKLNSLLVKYAGVLGTDVIAQPVAQQLGLSVQQVLSSVTADNNPADETLLLPITATASSPGLARRLSQAAANELTAYVAIQNGEFHIPAVDQFTLTTVDPASTPVRHGPSPTKAAADALALFVVGFVLGFVVVQLVRNRRLLVA